MNINLISINLAVEMTARTGELWRASQEPERHVQINSPSAWLTIYEHWRTHRLVIQASAPRKMRERTNGESITCDPKRTAEAIAGDITNRLLSHARAHLLESIKYDRERTLYENKKKLQKKMLSRWLPNEYNGDLHGNGLRASFTYDDKVKLSLELSMKEAIQLLKERK